MSAMPWIKVYTEMLDDPKMGRMDPATKWRFVSLCLLAGDCDANGYLVNGNDPLTIDDIAWRMRDNPEEMAVSMANLEAAGMLSHDDGAWLIVNFEKRQGRPQSEKRRLWRERKQRQRGHGEDTPDTPESVTRDSRVSPAPVTHLEESRVEESREEKSPGADAPSPTGDLPSPAPAAISAEMEDEQPQPTTFQGWQEMIRDSANRQSALRSMFVALYPGHDPPAYSRIGKVAKQVGGAGRLAELLWQNSTRQPTGDVLAYCQAMSKRTGGNGNGTRPQLTDEHYTSSAN